MSRRILHVFPSFAAGGAQMRMVALANHFGNSFSHRIVALDGDTACASRLDPALEVDFMTPPHGASLPARLQVIRRSISLGAPDLLITSNWGSIEWAMAARSIRGLRHLHSEDGFGPEERERQIPRRVWTRRLVLNAGTTIVPSRLLHRIATDTWRLPSRRVHYIPNGIDLNRFAPRTHDASERATPVIGCVAALRPEKNIGRLLRAAAIVARQANFALHIAGDGPERARLKAQAAASGITACFLGTLQDPAPFYRTLDIFALSSLTEQMPLSVMEAMASGLPVVATAVGDIAAMVAPENRAWLTAQDDDALAGALLCALRDPGRHAAGRANRARAEAEFGFTTMADRWRALIEGARATKEVRACAA